MSYYKPHTQDMSSYIAVQGTPRKDNCNVFGLTQQEVRYLKVGEILIVKDLVILVEDFVNQPEVLIFLSSMTLLTNKKILGQISE